MAQRDVPEDPFSGFLSFFRSLLQHDRSRSRLPSRWLIHFVVGISVLASTVVVAAEARIGRLDYSVVTSSPFGSVSSTARPTPKVDAVEKAPAVVTSFVNRPRQGVVTHVVQEGESLGLLSQTYNITVNTIAWANGISPSDVIHPGDKLLILPVSGVLHEVGAGETIDDIAARYFSAIDAIVDYNQMTDPRQLVPGEKLVIPGGRLDSASRQVATRTADQATTAAAQPATAPAPAPKAMVPFVYEVAPGDTLAGIASRYGLKTETVALLNDISDYNMIRPGQELTLLPVDGIVYKVQAGDSLADIAETLQADAASIIKANLLENADQIVVGQELIIPGGRLPQRAVAVAGPASAPASQPVSQPASQPAAQPAAAPAPEPASQPAPADTSVGSAIVSVASKYLGYAYVWGGSSPGTGFDCSGFTYWVYQEAGVWIPNHDLWGQMQSGPRVRQADLLPGDLVFFQNTYTAGLSHVGIYIGAGRFIHAASEGKGVRVDSVGDPYYWGPRYYGAARPW